MPADQQKKTEASSSSDSSQETRGGLDLTVVIPSYEAQDTIVPCLESVHVQKVDFHLEIIVVDSSPGDEVAKAVERFPRVRFLRLAKPHPPGLTRNEGVMRARGKLILFLDADVVLAKDSLQKVWENYQKGLKIFGGALVMPEDESSLSAWTEHCFFFHECQQTRPASVVKNLGTATLACDAELFAQAGLFTGLERCSDVEFVDRIRRSGVRTHFIPEIVGYRIQRLSFPTLLRKAYLCGTILYDLRFRSPSLLGRYALGLLLPIVMVAKVIRIIVRNAWFLRGRARWLSILVSPGVLLLGILWMLGLARSILRDLAGVKTCTLPRKADAPLPALSPSKDLSPDSANQTRSGPVLSVVIPSYRAANTIGACLDSVFLQNIDFDREIIVVDSSPDDGVAKIVANYSEVTLLRMDRRYPPGLARNEGVKVSKGKVILFLDADIVLTKDSLQRVWENYRKGLKVFGGALEMPEHESPLSAWTEHCFFFHESQQTRPTSEVRNLGTTVLACDAETFARIGSFTGLERCEDVEFVDRVRKSGIQTFFVPEIMGYRIQRMTFSTLLRKAYLFGLAAYGVRFRQPSQTRRIILGLLLPIFMMAKVIRIIGRNLWFLRGRGRLMSIIVSPGVLILGISWMLGLGRAILLDLAVGLSGTPRPSCGVQPTERILAYMTTCFAAIPHTFIRRELKALKAKGLPVRLYGVRRSQEPPLGEEERELESSTLYAYPVRLLCLLGRHFWFFVYSPRRYCLAFWKALCCRESRPIPRLKVLYHFFLAPSLAFDMYASQVGHIHAHFTNVAATLAMHCSRLLGITYSLTIHSAGETDLDSVHGIEDKIKGAKFLVAISRFTLEDFDRHVPCKDKAHVIPCGLDLGERGPPADHVNLGDRSRVRLLGIGRLEEKKGFEFLLRACHLLSQRSFEFELQVAGDGTLRSELEALRSELGLDVSVRFLGKCSQEEVKSRLSWCDLCLVPSVTAMTGEREGIPVVLMEAMSAGVPVIATRHSGIPELVLHEATGLLVPERDPSALAMAIERLSLDRQLRATCITGGRRIIEDHHDIQRIANQLDQCFRARLREASGRVDSWARICVLTVPVQSSR